MKTASIVLLTAIVVAGTACSSSSTPGNGTTGSGGSSSAATGGRSGSGTGGGTGTGTGGAAVVQKLCATKTTPMNPVLIDFESYDGTSAPDKFAVAFGGTMPNTGTAYAGPFAFGDGSATPTMALLAGHPPGQWAVSETVTQARTWGMGGGIWMGCANASAYKGISFWVRGSAPRGVFSFNLNMENTSLPDATNPAGGGTCAGTKDTCTAATKADIPLTMDWTEVRILWSEFTPGMSGTTSVIPNGDNITGLGWSVPLPFQLDPTVAADAAGPYVAIPGDLVINIDDVSFIP